ncbi:MAG: carbamoyltransferase HypF, partial [Ghiorsea sp.]|nr:carbamoyltransferase HypF [Ghiorsea sp.]
PFTNCTHCGPRLSIIREVPYDRKNTSMAGFTMCAACLAEYEDVKDRRFHAQPNACPDCGPQLQLLDAQAKPVATHDMLSTAADWIKQGKIIAIKGIGGIHLACDATNQQAVDTLRQRKHRFDKPFALMGKDVTQIRQYVDVSVQEEALLQGAEAPVMVLAIKQGQPIAPSVAPKQNTLGFMLPYTPLHHMLMAKLAVPIVLTSGNISDEPQCIANDDGQQRLRTLVDGYLLHNRDIVNRLDDSVAKMMAGKPRLLRRARGYAPGAMMLPAGFEHADGILALGGELKNTFCLLQDGQAIVSQHMGDLEHMAVHQDYVKNIKLYQQLYDFKATCIAVDKHPNYFSTQRGNQWAAEQDLQLIEVQHHHAHIAACMAEHGLPLGSEVLGIALDGLGMGEEGELWGGEFLHVSYQQCTRLGSIQTVAMLGGAKAMYEPWRNIFAQLEAVGWENIAQDFADLPLIQALGKKPVRNLQVMCRKGLNSPQASSMGRLFDATAAALGICFEHAAYEGQAAMALEVLAETSLTEHTQPYPFETIDENGISRIMWQPMWLSLLSDLKADVAHADIAAKFHQTVMTAVAQQAQKLAQQVQCTQIVLSGGVFQNKLLLEGVKQRLQVQNFDVLIPQDYPLNDGALSLGQAMIAAAKMDIK